MCPFDKFDVVNWNLWLTCLFDNFICLSPLYLQFFKRHPSFICLGNRFKKSKHCSKDFQHILDVNFSSGRILFGGGRQGPICQHVTKSKELDGTKLNDKAPQMPQI